MMVPRRAEFLHNERPTFIRKDPPERTALRRTLKRYFSVKLIAVTRDGVHAKIERLLDELKAGCPFADLVTALALPLPKMVIIENLGIPY